MMRRYIVEMQKMNSPSFVAVCVGLLPVLGACGSTTITQSNPSSGGATPSAGGSAQGSTGGTASSGGAASYTGGITASGGAATGVTTTGTGGNATGGNASGQMTTTGGNATGGVASGGTTTGMGGNATGGAASGGTAAGTGGNATGGAASGGTAAATGGNATGGAATGGSATGGGSSSGASTGGVGGGSQCSNLSTLHGKVEALADNLCRVSYDFSDVAQLSDWVVPNNADAQVSLSQGQMVVSYPSSASNSYAAVQFKLPLRTTRLAFLGTALIGNYELSAYVAVQWNGYWDPPYGYGFHYFGAGRQFVISGTSVQTSDTSVLQMNHTYDMNITMTSTRLSWTADANTVVYDTIALYQGKDRNVVLGAYESTLAFDNVVIEGAF